MQEIIEERRQRTLNEPPIGIPQVVELANSNLYAHMSAKYRMSYEPCRVPSWTGDTISTVAFRGKFSCEKRPSTTGLSRALYGGYVRVIKRGGIDLRLASVHGHRQRRAWISRCEIGERSFRKVASMNYGFRQELIGCRSLLKIAGKSGITVRIL